MSTKRQTSGQGMIEYIILIAVISIASLGIMKVLGNTVSKKLAQITLSLQGKQAKNIQDTPVEKKHWQPRGMEDFYEATDP